MKRTIISVVLGLLIGALFLLGFIFDPTYVYADTLTSSERNLVAKLTKAEAEGETDSGKRLVIDTILNRKDHESFPDSVEKVIFQKGQFTPSKILNNYSVDDNILKLILEEEINRTNSEVIFFKAGSYSSYGTPLFKEGNHYFSSYGGD